MRRVSRRCLVIVCYHGLTAERASPHWLILPLTDFRDQLAYLKRHYDIVGLDDALPGDQRVKRARPIACLTFDDGYRNNLTVGLPELVTQETPAVIYLPTAVVGTEGRLWPTLVELRIIDGRLAELPPSLADLGQVPEEPAARRVLAETVNERLKSMPAAARSHIVEDLISGVQMSDLDPDGHFALMSWEEVRSVEETGWVRFGAHTRHHGILSQLNDTGVEAEIVEAVKELQVEVRHPSRTFAYPNGRAEDYDHRSVTACRTAGVAAAVTTRDGCNTPGTDPYQLRRVVVGGDMTMDEFRLEVSGLLPLLRRLLGWLPR